MAMPPALRMQKQPALRLRLILRHHLDRENGDLFMALGRYNGSRSGKPEYQRR